VRFRTDVNAVADQRLCELLTERAPPLFFGPELFGLDALGAEKWGAEKRGEATRADGRRAWEDRSPGDGRWGAYRSERMAGAGLPKRCHPSEVENEARRVVAKSGRPAVANPLG